MVFLVKVLTVDLYDLLIKRFLSAILILFFADLLLATESNNNKNYIITNKSTANQSYIIFMDVLVDSSAFKFGKFRI